MVVEFTTVKMLEKQEATRFNITVKDTTITSTKQLRIMRPTQF